MANGDQRWTPDTIIRLIQASASALATLYAVIRTVRRRRPKPPSDQGTHPTSGPAERGPGAP